MRINNIELVYDTHQCECEIHVWVKYTSDIIIILYQSYHIIVRWTGNNKSYRTYVQTHTQTQRLQPAGAITVVEARNYYDEGQRCMHGPATPPASYIHTFIICDLPWQNQPYWYCADNWFWVKATITNYNLWTIAPANLKSLARVVMEIWAKIYPDRPYSSIAKKCNEHCYVRCTQKSVYSLFMQNTWPRPLSQWGSWLPQRWKESSSRRFDGKEPKSMRV
jgi:hypothetical protein